MRYCTVEWSQPCQYKVYISTVVTHGKLRSWQDGHHHQCKSSWLVSTWFTDPECLKHAPLLGLFTCVLVLVLDLVFLVS